MKILLINDSFSNIFKILDVAQQKEHDRRVAATAVAAARLEWEKQLQQQQPSKQIASQSPVASATIIHTGNNCININLLDSVK